MSKELRPLHLDQVVTDYNINFHDTSVSPTVSTRVARASKEVAEELVMFYNDGPELLRKIEACKKVHKRISKELDNMIKDGAFLDERMSLSFIKEELEAALGL